MEQILAATPSARTEESTNQTEQRLGPQPPSGPKPPSPRPQPPSVKRPPLKDQPPGTAGSQRSGPPTGYSPSPKTLGRIGTKAARIALRVSGYWMLPGAFARSASCWTSFLRRRNSTSSCATRCNTKSDFQISEVISPSGAEDAIDYDHRRSRVLMELGKHQDVIVKRIRVSVAAGAATTGHAGVSRELGGDPDHRQQ